MTGVLSIEVEFLMGRAVVSEWSERDRPEWPPHPQRLFSALVAAHSELDLGSDGEAALKWLEALPPPEIRAELDPVRRSVLSHWVPVNDESVRVEKDKKALGLKMDFRHVLDRRSRQERFFPTVVLRDPVVIYQWPTADGLAEHRSALSRMVQGLTYLGHSASPVRGCLRQVPANATLVPAAQGSYSLRVPSAGRFERLKQVHNLRLEDETVQPPLGRVSPYAKPDTKQGSIFSPEALILAFDSGPRLSLDSTMALMQHLRSAVLARLADPAPEILSGHGRNGAASKEAHLAFTPLAFVGGAHADGSLKGTALVLPRSADESARRMLRAALLAPWELHLGPLGSIAVRLVEEPSKELFSLRFDTYTRSSSCWTTVTPVFLDRHPKKGKLTAEQIISDACEKIGLPCPSDVSTGPVSKVSGAPTASEFRAESKQTDARVRRHVFLRFDRPVRGPILLGAGRFMGLGVFLPVSEAGVS